MSKRSERDCCAEVYATRAGSLSASEHTAQVIARSGVETQKASEQVSQEWLGGATSESLSLCWLGREQGNRPIDKNVVLEAEKQLENRPTGTIVEARPDRQLKRRSIEVTVDDGSESWLASRPTRMTFGEEPWI